MAEFTSLYAKDYQEGKTYQDWVQTSANTTLRAGYAWNGGKNWVMCIKFEIPTAAKSITLSFCNAQGWSSTPTFRYKFTTKEDESLFNATSAIVGDGTFTIKNGEWQRTTVTIEKTFPTGLYYMYIWTNNSNVDWNVMVTRWFNGEYGFIGSYEKLDGCIYIDNGSGWDAYEVWIDNGSSWDQYAPYIDNGTSWDEYG